NDDLTTCSVYKYWQRRFFNLQIGIKYRDFRKVTQEYLSQFALLKNKKEYKINRKLYSYVKPMKKKCPIDRKIVNNLSNRVLSDEETDCLANDLEFGLLPHRVDDMNIIGNIE
ncbi:unnamed protein product, partial [Adineta steineri]